MVARRWYPAIGVGTAFGLLTVAELAGDPLAGVDAAGQRWVLAHRSGTATAVARVLTDTGGSPLLCPVLAAAAAACWWRSGRGRPAVTALGVVGVGLFSRLLVSVAVRDPRPEVAGWLAPAHGFSFPSGHAAAGALVGGGVAWLVGGTWPRLRWVAYAGAGTWAVLVGVTRVYLGMHWATDVVGSWLLAGAWLATLDAVAAGADAGPGPAGGMPGPCLPRHANALLRGLSVAR